MNKSYDGFLQSHLLWSGTQFGLRQFQLPLPQEMDMDFAAIPPHLRLGHQVEHIFLELLKASDQYDIIAHSIQLIENKETLGELDYIIHCTATGEIIHLELTYKFYLLDPRIEGSTEKRLIGPNRSDAFAYKLDKTKNKQLPLLYSAASKLALGIDVNNITQQVSFYAQVFIPYGDEAATIGMLNRDCISGYWMDVDCFLAQDFEKCTFYFPTRSEWLHIPHRDVNYIEYQAAVALIQKLHSTKRSPMIWLKSSKGNLFKTFVTHWSVLDKDLEK